MFFNCLFLLACSAPIRILSYNVENLFDDEATGGEYPEYRGPRWTAALYERKLAAVARAIRASCRGGPELAALQEVESAKALNDLRDRLGYRHAVFVPQPGAATGVAFLSRLPVQNVRAHAVGSFAGEPLRHIVELTLEHRGRRLAVLNNHWKSKTEGVELTAPSRRLAEAALARRISELRDADPAVDLIALGDFNENVEDFEARVRELGLYNPWFELPEPRRGSAAYQGRWQTPDHMLLAPGLFDRRGFAYRSGGFRVVRPDFLLEGPQGLPRRFRDGTGTSDHLPLLLTLSLGRP